MSLAHPKETRERKDAAREAARTFTITELAQEFDITPRAIRFYEDMHLLEPARDGRNRVYSQRDRTRLKLTLRGKRLGLSLQEVKQLVDMYESPSDTALNTCHRACVWPDVSIFSTIFPAGSSR